MDMTHDCWNGHLEQFISGLEHNPCGNLFNPWYQCDEYDMSDEAPEIRRRHLRCYLQSRRNARYLFVAEALSHRGGRFSGIPMTSERILLGHQARRDHLSPGQVLPNICPSRTSNPCNVRYVVEPRPRLRRRFCNYRLDHACQLFEYRSVRFRLVERGTVAPIPRGKTKVQSQAHPQRT